MAVEQTLVLEHNYGGTSKRLTEVVSSGQEINISEDIPNSSTDLEVACAFVAAKLKLCYVWATGTLLLETNSGGAPTNTFSLTADKPLVWTPNMYHANPFTANVTALFATNSSGATVTLNAKFVVDPT